MSHAQASLPVLASKPWITPDGAQRHWPSRIWCGTTTIPLTIVGAELIEAEPGDTQPMPILVSCCPVPLKSVQAFPVIASTAIRRLSSVPSMIRLAHGLFAAAPGTLCQTTPRQAVVYGIQASGTCGSTRHTGLPVAASSAMITFLAVH